MKNIAKMKQVLLVFTFMFFINTSCNRDKEINAICSGRIELIMAKDADFNLFLENYIILSEKISQKAKLMSDNQRKEFLSEVENVSQKSVLSVNDLTELSQLLDFDDKDAVKTFINNFNKSIGVVVKKFPETKTNKAIDYQFIIENSSLNKNLLSNARTTCKPGYEACLVKSWAEGSAGVLGCTTIGPLGFACGVFVTIRTFASYRECQIMYCPEP